MPDRRTSSTNQFPINPWRARTTGQTLGVHSHLRLCAGCGRQATEGGRCPQQRAAVSFRPGVVRQRVVLPAPLPSFPRATRSRGRRKGVWTIRVPWAVR